MEGRSVDSVDNSGLPEDLERCIAFHGHLCGGLLTGYRAAKAAMEILGAERAVDEEIVAIVENDSCAVDAVQVLTGCTFGKGNFIFRDYGKHVYTFAIRPSGRAVRLSRRPREETPPSLTREADEETRRRRHHHWMLTAPVEELFHVERTTVALPPAAEVRESVVCQACGEPVMVTRTRRKSGRVLCIPCAETFHERENATPPATPE